MKVPLHERIPVDRWPVWVRRVAVYAFGLGPLVLGWGLGVDQDDGAGLHAVVMLAGWTPTVFILGLYGYPPHATRSSADWVRACLRGLGGVSILWALIGLITILSVEAGELALPHMNRDN